MSADSPISFDLPADAMEKIDKQAAEARVSLANDTGATESASRPSFVPANAPFKEARKRPSFVPANAPFTESRR